MSGLAIGAAGPSAYWYLARGTGAVSLVLLTGAVVLGVVDWGRVSFARWPRFAIDSLHRDVSLLVIVLLVVHIATSVLDSFAPIRLVDAVVPLASKYRPLWLGLGALSFDLLLALAATSLLRRRVGYRVWRRIHWLAYASWPVAVLHGLGSGSDSKATWMLVLSAACVAAVLTAGALRIAWSDRPGWRAPATLLALATPVGLVAFAALGPLQPGWARRAGTPANLLPAAARPAAHIARSTAPATGSPVTATGSRGDSLKAPFSGRLTGSVKQRQAAGGAIIDLALRVTGGTRGKLRVRMAGAPSEGGGLSMTGSQVDLSALGLASVLEGRIVSLQGDQFLARLHDASGAVVDLRASLNIDNRTSSVSGTLSASPVTGGSGP